MGCCCSKTTTDTKTNPLYPTESFPKYNKVWRTLDYRHGYSCTVCARPASCISPIGVMCHPSDHFVTNNEWHHHCQQTKKVAVLCDEGHYTMQVVRTGCECGWINGTELFI